MAPKNNALPDDIKDFFEGTSAFFPSPPTPSQKADKPTVPGKSIPKAITERSNGRTVEPRDDVTERSNGGTPERVSDTTERSIRRIGEQAIEETNHHPTQPRAQANNPLTQTNEPKHDKSMQEGDDSIIERLKQGKVESRQTERYSFEIFMDQRENIEEFLYQYKKRTGEKLSVSKFLRAMIDYYFHTVVEPEN